MFGRGMPTQGRGEGIKASEINADRRSLAGLLKMRVGPGLDLRWLGDSPLISLAGGLGLLGVEIARAPSPIPGRLGSQLGGGPVELYDLSPVGSLSPSSPTRTVTALNLAAAGVAANVYLILLRVAGHRIVVWEECPAAEPANPPPGGGQNPVDPA